MIILLEKAYTWYETINNKIKKNTNKKCIPQQKTKGFCNKFVYLKMDKYQNIYKKNDLLTI